ncbi:hypothetical protein BDP27DRAFT_448724 [Rhodocollybia butyracea]|uniref:Uncharacterized protein n=1 Tax=Rhodocollybia butyracea TaxID=206335 RepID=A0A9P5TYX7_9AGAR|nr:hypothetical protein BDP27DRAFT_448724 [Rhodocollybia butyracea]
MAVRSDVVVTDNLDVPSAGVTTMVESLERPAPVLVSQLGSAASTETAQHPTMLGYYSDEVHPSIMTKDLPEHTSTWEAAVVTEANLEGLIRMASDPLELFEPYDEEITNNEEDICDTKSSWLGGVEKDFEADGVDESQRRRVTTKRATAVKEDMQFLLVHGDVLLLSGDDFDYGIERKGMGLLLVGST